MEEEIWKDYEGYEGIYQVSNLGNIKRLSAIVVDSIGRTREIPGHTLKKYSGTHGYEYVTISHCGRERSEFVHRMVAKMFIENDDPINKTEVNHLDENKKNNIASNLAWVSRSENKRYGTATKRMLETRRCRNAYGSEKTVGKFSSDGILLVSYKSASEAARKNNTNVTNICACCRGARKMHIGYIWKYI